MITLAGNMLAAIDVETTGLDPKYDEIWEIAIVPVDFNLRVDKTRPIFDLVMKPTNLEDERALQLSGVDKKFIEENGVEPGAGAEIFHKWFERLGLGARRRITPLAHNWKFDCQFISNWLGFDSYQTLFDGRHRDTLQLAIGLNDAFELAGLEIPFPKQNLTFLCSRLDVKLDYAHRALEDARATIEVYRKLVKRIDL